MKRSKPLVRRTPLRNKTPMKRSGFNLPSKNNPRKPMKKKGRRGAEWDKIRKQELVPAFKAAGITRCEVCGTDNYLGFAHRRKRRDCTTPELMRDCALLCHPCHDAIEGLPHAEMEAAVRRVISSRKAQPILPAR